MPLTIVTPANDISAVEIGKLKKHLRLVVSDAGEYTTEDALLADMILAATEEYQDRFKVSLIEQEYRWDFDGFKRKLELPRPPTKSITKVEFVNESGTLTEIDSKNYRTVTTMTPGYVLFNSDYTFPDTEADEPWPVRVTYKAGYGEEIGAIPASVRQYLMNIIGTLYSQRKTVLVNYGSTMGYEDLRGLFAGLIAGKPKAMRFG